MRADSFARTFAANQPTSSSGKMSNVSDGHICDGNRGHNAQDCPASILAVLERVLRDQHRIKVNVDYAITHKYNQYHLLCNTVWVDAISTEADRLGIHHFSTVHTYS